MTPLHHPPVARRRFTPRALLPVLASLGAFAAAVPAQVVPSVGVGTHAQDQRGTSPVSGLALAPALRAAAPFGTLDASALQLFGTGGAGVSRDFWTGSVAAALTTPRRRALRGEVGSTMRRDLGAGFAPVTSVQAETRLRYDRAGFGLWTSQSTGAATSEGGRHFGGLGAGFWTRVRGVTITTSLGWMRTRDSTAQTEQYTYETIKGYQPDTVFRDSVWKRPGGDSVIFRVPTGVVNQLPIYGDTTETRMRWALGPLGYTDLESGLAWAPRRGVEVHASAGTRIGLAGRGGSWGTASASMQVSRYAALVASAGRTPEDPARGLPARSYASLGMRFARTPLLGYGGPPPVAEGGSAGGGGAAAPERWAFDVVAGAEGEGSYTLVVRAPTARAVEVMGSFTDWQPVALASSGDGRWQATLRIPRGIHQVNMRVNGGAWRAPPGLTTTVDGFNGTVGVLVIE